MDGTQTDQPVSHALGHPVIHHLRLQVCKVCIASYCFVIGVISGDLSATGRVNLGTYSFHSHPSG